MDRILDQASTPGLGALIYSGKTNNLIEFLAQFPGDGTLIFANEPYCNIQGKRKSQCLKILCDDSRFQFDHLFVARMLYFSTEEVHKTILNHQRFKKLMKDTSSFMKFFWENYPGGQRTYMGMSQRYIQAENAIYCKKKRDNIRITFFLYPFLVSSIRKFLEKYYAPGGKGYLTAEMRFRNTL